MSQTVQSSTERGPRMGWGVAALAMLAVLLSAGSSREAVGSASLRVDVSHSPLMRAWGGSLASVVRGLSAGERLCADCVGGRLDRVRAGACGVEGTISWGGLRLRAALVDLPPPSIG